MTGWAQLKGPVQLVLFLSTARRHTYADSSITSAEALGRFAGEGWNTKSHGGLPSALDRGYCFSIPRGWPLPGGTQLALGRS
jgi:hypothetical protein